MKYTPISISPEQAQFLETRKFQVNEIARIFRVPPHMVGDLEKSSFSNIEQQSLEFVKYTLDPWGIRWDQSIQRSLLNAEKEAVFCKIQCERTAPWRLPEPHERVCHWAAERLDVHHRNNCRIAVKRID